MQEGNGINTNASNGDPSDYEEAYNDLYDEHGYHADSELSHEGPSIEKLVAFSKTASPAMNSILVLGCSHGKGASILHKHGFNTYGIDVAHKAIAMAKQLRGAICSTEPVEPCFRQGSLTKLSYPSSFVDAGMSVDVLEHIAPDDVPAVVSEISRVVKHYLYVSIASFKEYGKNGEKAGMKNLHLTVKNAEWWSAQFAKGGWNVVEDTSTLRRKEAGSGYVNLLLSKQPPVGSK